MKNCPQCGAPIKDTAKFCMKCGCNIAQYEAEQAGGVILSGMRRPPRRRGAVLSGIRPEAERGAGAAAAGKIQRGGSRL